MKILIVGGGGREHAIATKIKLNPLAEKIYCAPGNGGTAEICENVPIKATDMDGIISFAAENKIDYAIVAQDDPLCMGMVDRLKQIGVPAFGPAKDAARIEGSKIFAKELMKKYNIPTAKYESFASFDEAVNYVKSQKAYPLVVKADGLALGKGVIICQNETETLEALRGMMKDRRFGASGENVVIEEFMTGPEVSLLTLTDGNTVKPLSSSMDHKRALDGDQGLNTGGMGAVAPNPYFTDEVKQRAMDEIVLPTIKAMQSEGCPFKGCLYFGLMITKDGPKVVEYNCRFGDPETQAVLPLMKSDLLTAMIACTEGKLNETDVEFDEGYCCCVVSASGGYPVSYKSGYEISGIYEAEKTATVYHAGTKLTSDGKLVTSGGRVLGVSATGETLKEAIDKAYEATNKISFENRHFRRDIGVSALKAEA